MHSSADDIESLLRCAKIVAIWFIALTILPPNGILWQLDLFNF